MNEDIVVPITAFLSIFVFSPLAIAVARLIWRRAANPPLSQAMDADTSRRLMEMQQTMEAMAIEIERISEGQRFVTKLLSERPAAALPAPAAKTSAPKRGP